MGGSSTGGCEVTKEIPTAFLELVPAGCTGRYGQVAARSTLPTTIELSGAHLDSCCWGVLTL